MSLSNRLRVLAAKSPKKIVWYHGGPEIKSWDNLRMDRDRSTSSLNVEGPGLYWTSSRKEAVTYLSGPNPTLYEAVVNPDFRAVPAKKPTPKFLWDLYQCGDEESQEIFLSNWGVEYHGTKPAQVKAILAKHYGRQETMMDAAVYLYGDLFRHNAQRYVRAMVEIGYDGFLAEKGTTGGSDPRLHLIVFNPQAMTIREADFAHSEDA